MKAIVPEARWDESRQYWKVNVQQNGVRKSFYEKTPGRRGQRICEAKAQEWVESNCPTDMKFAQAWEKFLEYKKAHVSEETLKGYISSGAVHILPVLRSKKLSAISTQDWQDLVDKARNEGYAVSSCENLIGKIKNFAKFARKARLPVEPVEDIEVYGEKTSSRTTLQPEHLRTLFSVDTRVYKGRRRVDEYIHAFRFAALTGLRRGELVGLRWENVSDDLTVVSVERSITPALKEKKGKTQNARRTFILPDLAVKELQAQRQMMRELGVISPWVFPTRHGELVNPQVLLARWHSYCEDNGLPDFVLHELRHTAVSMYETVVPEKMLKSAIGHSEHMDTSGVYGHKFGDEDRQAAKLMDQVLARVFG